jgi:hypothetical protein
MPNHVRRAIAAFVVGSSMCFAPSVLAATNPPEYSGALTIAACYNQTNGQVRLVKPWEPAGCIPPAPYAISPDSVSTQSCQAGGAFDCKTNEYFVELNTQGPKGDQGIQGPIGPTGPQGPQGIQGVVGPTGPHGPQGVQGPKGDTGDAGATGSAGAQGPKGDKGDTGDTGATGVQGPKGDKGDAGATGVTGAQGPKGDTGPAGAAGAAGPVGPSGDGLQVSTELPGPHCAAGGIRVVATFGGVVSSFPEDTRYVCMGELGPKGDRGEKGEQGPVGRDGAPGAPGPDGAPGPGAVVAAEPPGANCQFGGTRVSAGGVITFVCNAGTIAVVHAQCPMFSQHLTTQLPAGVQEGSMVVEDFNRDGRLDFAVFRGDGAEWLVNLFLGNGDGTFQAPIGQTVNGNARMRMSVRDLNHDAKLDLVVWGGDRAISVLLGNGDGTFQPNVDMLLADVPVALVMGDLNTDGKLDLVAAFRNVGFNVHLGNGDGTFLVAPASYLDPSSGHAPMLLADLNRDGALDLVTVGGELLVRLGIGNGDFQLPIPTPLYQYVTSMAAGDFNGDGRLDIIFVGLDPADGHAEDAVLLGAGNGAFQQPIGSPYNTAQVLAVGDFNRDGRLDYANPYLRTGKGNGGVEGCSEPAMPANYGYSFEAGDFNNDGKLDLATLDRSLNEEDPYHPVELKTVKVFLQDP